DGRSWWDFYRRISWACTWRNSSSTKSGGHSTSKTMKDLSILIPRWSRSWGARTYSYGANGTAWVEDVGGRQEAAGLRTALYEENIMDYKEILYEVDHRVATITLNRPETLNAFTDVMLDEWTDALEGAQQDDNVWVVV